MPKFPKREADITVLAYRMILGYVDHRADFPHIDFSGITMLIVTYSDYKTARDVQGQAYAVVKLATDNKIASLGTLRELMKKCLKKSQVDVAGDPDKLQYIGWGPKAPPSPVDPPGQPRNLEAIIQGANTVLLDFKAPARGSDGNVRTYVIEQRNQPQGGGDFSNWQPVGTALETEATLTGQQRGVQLEYRVKAINIGGESVPSNTAAVVL